MGRLVDARLRVCRTSSAALTNGPHGLGPDQNLIQNLVFSESFILDSFSKKESGCFQSFIRQI